MISGKLQGQENLQRALQACNKLATGNQFAVVLKTEIKAAVAQLQNIATQKAPVEEGTLRGSAKSNVQLTGTKAQATVTFGGQAADYASVQHERDDFVHPKGGQAHYLFGAPDSAAEEAMPDIVKILDAEAGRLADKWLQGQI